MERRGEMAHFRSNLKLFWSLEVSDVENRVSGGKTYISFADHAGSIKGGK